MGTVGHFFYTNQTHTRQKFTFVQECPSTSFLLPSSPKVAKVTRSRLYTDTKACFLQSCLLQPGLTYPGGSGWEFAVVGVLLVLSLKGVVDSCLHLVSNKTSCVYIQRLQREGVGGENASQLVEVCALSLSLSHSSLENRHPSPKIFRWLSVLY